jgi:hypothetical protein
MSFANVYAYHLFLSEAYADSYNITLPCSSATAKAYNKHHHTGLYDVSYAMTYVHTSSAMPLSMPLKKLRYSFPDCESIASGCQESLNLCIA